MANHLHEEIESSLQGEQSSSILGHNGVSLVNYEYLGLVLKVK